MVRFRPVSCLPDSKLSRMKSLWIHWFTTVENRCASRNLCCFGKRVRVSPFFDEKASNPHLFRVRYCVRMKRSKFLDFYLILIRRFGLDLWNASIRYCFHWFLLEFWNELVNFAILLLFFSEPVRISWIFFPSSSQSSRCDRTGFVASGDEFSAWIAASKAQWWGFTIVESLRAWNFLTEFCYGFFWSNWYEREGSDSVCELALMNGALLWFLTLFTIYNLPCVHLGQWRTATWTGSACVASGLESEKRT